MAGSNTPLQKQAIAIRTNVSETSSGLMSGCHCELIATPQKICLQRTYTFELWSIDVPSEVFEELRKRKSIVIRKHQHKNMAHRLSPWKINVRLSAHVEASSRRWIFRWTFFDDLQGFSTKIKFANSKKHRPAFGGPYRTRTYDPVIKSLKRGVLPRMSKWQ